MKHENLILGENDFLEIKSGQFSLLRASNNDICLHIYINPIFQPKIEDAQQNSPLCSECTLIPNEKINIEITIDPIRNNENIAMLILRKILYDFSVFECSLRYH